MRIGMDLWSCYVKIVVFVFFNWFNGVCMIIYFMIEFIEYVVEVIGE